MGGEIFEVLDPGVPSTHERLQPLLSLFILTCPIQYAKQGNIQKCIPKEKKNNLSGYDKITAEVTG